MDAEIVEKGWVSGKGKNSIKEIRSKRGGLTGENAETMAGGMTGRMT